MKIEYLFDHPDKISELARWYMLEWEPYYGSTGPGDARADLEARCSREDLPVGFVALEGGRVLGSAALGLDVTTNLKPSIIGLIVGPNYRRRGVGTALIDACADVARELGHERLFISTSVLGTALDRLGWQVIGDAKFLNDEHGLVYVRDL